MAETGDITTPRRRKKANLSSNDRPYTTETNISKLSFSSPPESSSKSRPRTTSSLRFPPITPQPFLTSSVDVWSYNNQAAFRLSKGSAQRCSNHALTPFVHPLKRRHYLSPWSTLITPNDESNKVHTNRCQAQTQKTPQKLNRSNGTHAPKSGSPDDLGGDIGTADCSGTKQLEDKCPENRRLSQVNHELKSNSPDAGIDRLGGPEEELLKGESQEKDVDDKATNGIHEPKDLRKGNDRPVSTGTGERRHYFKHEKLVKFAEMIDEDKTIDDENRMRSWHGNQEDYLDLEEVAMRDGFVWSFCKVYPRNPRYALLGYIPGNEANLVIAVHDLVTRETVRSAKLPVKKYLLDEADLELTAPYFLDDVRVLLPLAQKLFILNLDTISIEQQFEDLLPINVDKLDLVCRNEDEVLTITEDRSDIRICQTMRIIRADFDLPGQVEYEAIYMNKQGSHSVVTGVRHEAEERVACVVNLEDLELQHDIDLARYYTGPPEILYKPVLWSSDGLQCIMLVSGVLQEESQELLNGGKVSQHCTGVCVWNIVEASLTSILLDWKSMPEEYTTEIPKGSNQQSPEPNSVAILDNDVILCGCEDYQIRAFNITGELLYRLEGHCGSVEEFHMSLDQTRCLTRSSDLDDLACILWDLEGRRKVAMFIFDEDPGEILSVGNCSSIAYHEKDSPELKFIFLCGDDGCQSHEDDLRDVPILFKDKVLDKLVDPLTDAEMITYRIIKEVIEEEDDEEHSGNTGHSTHRPRPAEGTVDTGDVLYEGLFPFYDESEDEIPEPSQNRSQDATEQNKKETDDTVSGRKFEDKEKNDVSESPQELIEDGDDMTAGGDLFAGNVLDVDDGLALHDRNEERSGGSVGDRVTPQEQNENSVDNLLTGEGDGGDERETPLEQHEETGGNCETGGDRATPKEQIEESGGNDEAGDRSTPIEQHEETGGNDEVGNRATPREQHEEAIEHIEETGSDGEAVDRATPIEQIEETGGNGEVGDRSTPREQHEEAIEQIEETGSDGEAGDRSTPIEQIEETGSDGEVGDRATPIEKIEETGSDGEVGDRATPIEQIEETGGNGKVGDRSTPIEQIEETGGNDEAGDRSTPIEQIEESGGNDDAGDRSTPLEQIEETGGNDEAGDRATPIEQIEETGGNGKAGDRATPLEQIKETGDDEAGDRSTPLEQIEETGDNDEAGDRSTPIKQIEETGGNGKAGDRATPLEQIKETGDDEACGDVSPVQNEETGGND